MTRIKFVMTSRDKEFRIPETAFSDFNTKQDQILTVPQYNLDNKTPLTKLYNDLFAEERDRGPDGYDYLVLLHADALVSVENLCTKIAMYADKYDIMGLAGTKVVDTTHSPLSWFTASTQYPDKRYGSVWHDQLGDMGRNLFNSHDPRATDARVSIIDGLCIIVSKKVIDSGIRFDERFTFDFYDIDFCFTAVMLYKFRIGVLVELVIHGSVGMAIRDKSYLKPEILFREKWKLKPIQVS